MNTGGARYIEALHGARALRFRAYESGLLWKPGTHTQRWPDPAPWPLFWEPATRAERQAGVPQGTVDGSEQA